MRINNEKIINASVIAAGMVVAIHTAGMEIGLFKIGSCLWWWLALGMYGFFQIAVPFFFLCSGYFIAGHMDENGWYGQECKKRVWSLLIPYLFWCILYSVLIVLIDFASNLMHGRVAIMDIGIRFWTRTLGLSPFEYPRLWPMWYVRTLMVFVVISPILKRIIKTMGTVGLLVLLALSSCFEIHQWTPQIDFAFSKGFSLFGLFFFFSGLFLRTNVIRLPTKWGVVALTVGCCVVLGIACLRRWYDVSWFPRTICSILLIFGLWQFIPTRPFPVWMTTSTFAVFVMHPFFLYLWDCILQVPISTIGLWFLKWLIVFGGPIIVAQILRHYFPITAKYVFGRR